MDTLFFHPKVVHLPMALGVLMPLVAAGLTLAWWRRWLPWRAWLIAIGLQVALVVSGVAALRSGEAEEDRVERVVPEAALESHEEAAVGFVWASGAVLVVMLVAATFGRRRFAPAVALAATVGTLVVAGLGYRTGQAGGSLVYQHGAARAYVIPAADGAPIAAPLRDDDDDD